MPLQGQAPHPGFQVPLFGLTSTQSGSTTTVGLESAAKNLFSIPKPSTKLQTMPLTATSDMRDQDAWYGATSFSQMPGKSARKIPYEAPHQIWDNAKHIFYFGDDNIIDVDE